MAKRALADVLWEAANQHLQRLSFSCNAAMKAEFGERLTPSSNYGDLRPQSQSNAFLRSLGCDTNSQYAFWTPGFVITDPLGRMGVRYMWLLLAMHVAEDEKIMVEVSR